MPPKDPNVPGQPQAAPEKLVSLLQILSLFSRIGLSGFGGGLSAWIYREVVDKRKWLDEGAFLSGLTLSQILPGPNVVNLSIYIGQRLRGTRGSITAVLALLVPPMILTLILVVIFDHFTNLAWLHNLLEGVAAGALGLTFSVAYRSARYSTARDRWAPLLILAIFVLVGLLRWPMIPVVLVAAPLGILLARRKS